MTRGDILRVSMAVCALLIAVVVRAEGHLTPAVQTTDLVFRSFDLPEPSPTAIPGLHEYGAPLRSAPTASPQPVQSARPKATSAAGHTSVGSGPRTIRPSHNIRGKASWHATGRSGQFAAACYDLRKAIGPDWRGQTVLVAVGRRALEVRLNDWCGSHDKLIDLSDEAFRYFAPLSRGVIRVAVGW